MSKLAHSNQESMDEIERKALEAEERGERDEPPEVKTLIAIVDRVKGNLLRNQPDGEWHDGVTATAFEINKSLVLNREALILAGLKSLTDAYGRDFAFANAGFTIGVVRAVIDGICPTRTPQACGSKRGKADA